MEKERVVTNLLFTLVVLPFHVTLETQTLINRQLVNNTENYTS